MIDLDELAQAASCLEPLPTSVTRLAGIVGEDRPEVGEVVEVVQYDQALTATLLRAANSSWSASRAGVSTVKDAVVRLGAQRVVSLALGVSVRGRLDVAVPEYGLSEGALWNHSVAASLAAELILAASPAPLTQDVVTAALLHDVGKLVMCRYLSPDVLSLLGRSRDEGGSTMIDSETEILGVHHAELGGLILQCWGLPESLVRSVSYHHTPELATDPTAYGVHLADVVAGIVRAQHAAAAAEAAAAAAAEAGLAPDPGAVAGATAEATAAADEPADGRDVDRFAHALAELRLDADALDEIVATAGERLSEVLDRYDA